MLEDLIRRAREAEAAADVGRTASAASKTVRTVEATSTAVRTVEVAKGVVETGVTVGAGASVGGVIGTVVGLFGPEIIIGYFVQNAVVQEENERDASRRAEWNGTGDTAPISIGRPNEGPPTEEMLRKQRDEDARLHPPEQPHLPEEPPTEILPPELNAPVGAALPVVGAIINLIDIIRGKGRGGGGGGGNNPYDVCLPKQTDYRTAPVKLPEECCEDLADKIEPPTIVEGRNTKSKVLPDEPMSVPIRNRDNLRIQQECVDYVRSRTGP